MVSFPLLTNLLFIFNQLRWGKGAKMIFLEDSYFWLNIWEEVCGKKKKSIFVSSNSNQGAYLVSNESKSQVWSYWWQLFKERISVGNESKCQDIHIKKSSGTHNHADHHPSGFDRDVVFPEWQQCHKKNSIRNTNQKPGISDRILSKTDRNRQEEIKWTPIQ